MHAAASGVDTQAIQLARMLGAGRVYGTTRSRTHARVLDGPYLEDNLHAAAIKGHIVGVGRLGSATGTLDMEELARKRVELIGVTFRTRSDEEKFAIARASRTVDLETNADTLRPVIDRTYAWSQVLEAQEGLADNAHVGKIVLEVTQQI
ncbi:zinc-binding dehydrogenase [Nocardia sp. NPDC051750]|uniref:zinc-binding dehydrogenase n=1 Tax=Nocardia sp. NPDC051750 TaxID=3364325 RepID=UPI0037BBE9FB